MFTMRTEDLAVGLSACVDGKCLYGWKLKLIKLDMELPAWMDIGTMRTYLPVWMENACVDGKCSPARNIPPVDNTFLRLGQANVL